MSSSPVPADSEAAAGPLAGPPPGRAGTGGVLPARTSGRRRGGRGVIAGSLVLAGAGAVAGTVAAVMALVPSPAPTPRLPRGTVFSLRAGQCADTAPDGVTGARAIPCGQPHQAEVYATYRLAGTGWPGPAAAARRARQGCLGRLAGYLDPSLVGSSLTASYAYPDRPAWLAGERTAVCEIRSATGQLTGSVRGLGLSTG